jgi:hypothetical protein
MASENFSAIDHDSWCFENSDENWEVEDIKNKLKIGFSALKNNCMIFSIFELWAVIEFEADDVTELSIGPLSVNDGYCNSIITRKGEPNSFDICIDSSVNSAGFVSQKKLYAEAELKSPDDNPYLVVNCLVEGETSACPD